MDQLCDDVASLVLSRTTRRTLITCKSLTKRWLLLASAEQLSREAHVPGFIVRTIFGKPPYRTKLLPQNPDEEPRDLKFMIPGGDDNIKIVASGNGLLFCVRELTDGTISDDCYLYNPFTDDCIVVIRPTMNCHLGAHGLNIGLAFDLLDGDVVIVSAYPFWTRESDNWKFGFEIYSLASRKWRISNHVSEFCNIYKPLRMVVCQTGAVFFNSKLYWSFWSSNLLEFDPVCERSRWRYVPCFYGLHLAELNFNPQVCMAGWLGVGGDGLVFVFVTPPTVGALQNKIMFYTVDDGFRWKRLWSHSLGTMQQLAGVPLPHNFHPVGIVGRSLGGGASVVLSTPCGRTVMFDAESRKIEIVMDPMVHVDPPISDPSNPYPLEPQYYPYIPTTKQIISSKRIQPNEGDHSVNMMVWGTDLFNKQLKEHDGANGEQRKSTRRAVRRSLWIV